MTLPAELISISSTGIPSPLSRELLDLSAAEVLGWRGRGFARRVAALREGYITVTPLQFDMTDHTLLGRWKEE